MKARMLAGASLAAVLAIPATAQADTMLTGGPVKVRDYKMSVIGIDAGAKDSLMVMFIKTSGKSAQQHMYSFDSGVKVTPTSIKGSLGKYGAVNLKLGGTKTTRGRVPAGCTGRAGSAKSGTLSGSFRLVADSTYFKTVTAKSMKGTGISGGSIKCGEEGGSGGGGGGGTARKATLTQTQTDGATMFSFTAQRGIQTALQMDNPAATAPARIMHIITAPGNPGLDLGAGGTSATVKANTPFLTGNGTFAGESAGGPVVTGTLSGNLRAAFDSIGAIDIAGDAMVMNP